MRLGICLPVEYPGVSGETLLEWMSPADEGTFDTVAVTDEIASGTYEGMVMLAAAAARTGRVRLMSVVIAGPLRRVALLAKQAASIDALSDGLLSLGLGLGELREDFAAVGVEMRGRGKRFGAQLELMKRIWAGEPMGESGRNIGPTPVQPGDPELLLGGWAPRALARVERYVDGYIDAIMAEEMVSDRSYRIAEKSWREHGRPGNPRFVTNVHFALGREADESFGAYIERSYAGQPEHVTGVMKVTPRERRRTSVRW
jgi:alkanesulfonate monooxygenase SsuD/methylene tetrahydromethanopterin reductase-like flavin-dependent oxidoreductase (luciferase family)